VAKADIWLARLEGNAQAAKPVLKTPFAAASRTPHHFAKFTRTVSRAQSRNRLAVNTQCFQPKPELPAKCPFYPPEVGALEVFCQPVVTFLFPDHPLSLVGTPKNRKYAAE